jgi:hypothetical protein
LAPAKTCLGSCAKTNAAPTPNDALLMNDLLLIVFMFKFSKWIDINIYLLEGKSNAILWESVLAITKYYLAPNPSCNHDSNIYLLPAHS